MFDPSPGINLDEDFASHAAARKFPPLPCTLEYPDLTINSPPALDPDDPEVNGIVPLYPDGYISSCSRSTYSAAHGDQSIYT